MLLRRSKKKIKESVDRMILLVNNLLDLRKIEEGKMEYQFGETDIVKLVSDIADDFEVIAEQKGLKLEFQSATASLKIKADQARIREVFQNLISNAIKYTDKGYVKVSLSDEGQEIHSNILQNVGMNSVVISVEDSGRGMSEELRQKIFQQFARDEQAAKEIQGVGLGLYIAKEIVTAHHGEIWAESDGEGKGSRFFVRLKKS